MFIGKLESFDDPQALFNGPSDGKIVDMRSPQSTLGVDEKGSSERDTFFLEMDTVGFRDGVGSVRKLISSALTITERAILIVPSSILDQGRVLLLSCSSETRQGGSNRQLLD
jgi:hypothetical protein